MDTLSKNQLTYPAGARRLLRKGNLMNHLCKMPVMTLVMVAVIGFSSGKTASTPATTKLVYEIFVRSFCDSENDAKGNGDLKGVASKLDSYLNDGDPKTSHDLEVGILWLMPIFPANSYHGYDVKDYRDINSDYGTLQDF